MLRPGGTTNAWQVYAEPQAPRGRRSLRRGRGPRLPAPLQHRPLPKRRRGGAYPGGPPSRSPRLGVGAALDAGHRHGPPADQREGRDAPGEADVPGTPSAGTVPDPGQRVLRVAAGGPHQAAVLHPSHGRRSLRVRGPLRRVAGAGGRPLWSCCIVTTTPNDLMSRIHDRMPCILMPGDEAAWLDVRGVPGAEDLARLRPYPDGELETYPDECGSTAPRTTARTSS